MPFLVAYGRAPVQRVGHALEKGTSDSGLTRDPKRGGCQEFPGGRLRTQAPARYRPCDARKGRSKGDSLRVGDPGPGWIRARLAPASNGITTTETAAAMMCRGYYVSRASWRIKPQFE